MKYYVTIYIDPLVECFLDFKNQCYWQIEDFTHAFLGLTKDKDPDELDKIDEELIQGKINQSKILSKLVIIKQFIYIRSKFANSYLF
ncbi:hypothetical protein [Campylobacter volucris]|uniref:hypothetical protein n=1 Tax=Campylobacter volucris TaxID=1031542 RepID=UPI0018A072DE|nr:hypothetical protein [Campylobacter volucris]MBF7048714.1 hypothetical protein [Campylobacter volucris]